MTSQIQDLAISDLNAIPLTNTISFDYLRPTDVKVQVGTTLSNLAEKTYITHWSITNDKKIQFETSVFSATGTYKVRIYRITDASTPTHVFSAGASIRSQDLNDIAKQPLFVADEVRDTVNSLATDGSGISNVIVDGSNIADNSISSTKILDLEVKTADINDSAVTTDKIADYQVTTVKLANSNVTTPKIADSHVTTAKIAADAVTNAKIADNSIDSEHYADGSIDTAHIADAQITTAKVADNAITLAKIAPAAQIAIAPPTGTVLSFAGTSAPTGYFICNGDTVPNGNGTIQNITADFSYLYSIIGDALPAMTDNRFINHASTNIKSLHNQDWKSFTLRSQQVTSYSHESYMEKNTTDYKPDVHKWTAGNSGSQWGYELKWDDDSTSIIRPKNIVLLPIIKY